MRNVKHWTAEELLVACNTAREFKYKLVIFPVIGRELKRSPASVWGAVSRVRNGESTFLHNNKDPRFLKFVEDKRTIDKVKSKVKTKVKAKSIKNRKPNRKTSIKLFWGLIEITR